MTPRLQEGPLTRLGSRNSLAAHHWTTGYAGVLHIQDWSQLVFMSIKMKKKKKERCWCYKGWGPWNTAGQRGWSNMPPSQVGCCPETPPKSRLWVRLGEWWQPICPTSWRTVMLIRMLRCTQIQATGMGRSFGDQGLVLSQGPCPQHSMVLSQQQTVMVIDEDGGGGGEGCICLDYWNPQNNPIKKILLGGPFGK